MSEETKQRDDGGPAFARPAAEGYGGYGEQAGMTLRDYFAAKAMQALITSCVPNIDGDPYPIHYHAWASHAYAMADEMLARRIKGLGEFVTTD